MRKIPAALAVLTLATVGLAGCSLPGSLTGSSDCTRTAPDATTVDLVTVDGSFDGVPDVEVYTPFHTDETVFADAQTGEGTPITTAQQLVMIDVTLVSGTTGDVVAATYDGEQTRVFPLTQWEQTFPTIEEALHCATEGSRVVIALAPGDVEAETAASVGLAEDDSSIAVIDVRKVYLSQANGRNQFNSGHGLPTVVRAPDGRPGIIVPEGAAPSDLVVQTIKKGDGPVVTGEVPARVHYTGLTWAEREVFDTTWDSQPASMTLDAVVPGFAAALEGQTVGSQVMVVIPPDQGYGDVDQGAIPAGSTLVFVIDILGLDAAP
ncbi:FKBP-type peptidyl-prolyl cis-trans isomerase [Microbacterium sp. 2FI]|uniref:FKBP-type peptidyl-prolyl cis-trans isomerase n=1 Tax=Microbacterium sp. 2FI TaxID=2502193 RepID=UPI0010F99E10|nr:FKBP-type peptidyl-prolyl cis-trans isomerase [Microbacterium sp. 2FI]